MAADVSLVLEGTYPYVKGGVSEWTDRLVRGMPETSFDVLRLRYADAPSERMAYHPPPNVRQVIEVDLDPEDDAGPELDLDSIPEAGVYHALTTGWAGRLAGDVAARRARPFALTEHGLIWREAPMGSPGCHKGRLPSHHMLERLESLAHQAYGRADAVATVCASNVAQQAAFGAPRQKLRLIENPVDPVAASDADEVDGVLDAPTIGWIGRVVPLKDLATFLDACALVAAELPRARFAVVGPLDHDPAYSALCRELAEGLGLAESLVFTGETDTAAWYPRLDVLALTSRSEAQPLVLLEAMAAGVPVVASAVGGCPELLRPRDERGPAGLLTPTCDPVATAEAILALCERPQLRRAVVGAAEERIRTRHRTQRMLDGYRRLYEELTG